MSAKSTGEILGNRPVATCTEPDIETAWDAIDAPSPSVDTMSDASVSMGETGSSGASDSDDALSSESRGGVSAAPPGGRTSS
jgi:hypothetical protein